MSIVINILAVLYISTVAQNYTHKGKATTHKCWGNLIQDSPVFCDDEEIFAEPLSLQSPDLYRLS